MAFGYWYFFTAIVTSKTTCNTNKIDKNNKRYDILKIRIQIK